MFLEGQRKFTEVTCEDKLSVILDLNLGSFRYEAEVNVWVGILFFALDLFRFCHVINT